MKPIELRSILLPALLPALLLPSGLVAAAPGVEERPAMTAAAAAASSRDLSVAMFEQFQQFQAQLDALTGRIEELEHALRQAAEQDKARYLDIDARLKQLEQAAQRPAAAPSAGAPATAPGASPVETADSDEKALYDRAVALVKDKQYDASISAFEQQLKQYPRGEMAPLAMYWLGEMWLVAATPDAAKAGRYFYRVYNESPKSLRASTAMYRHGLLQCQHDEVAKGRVTLSKVLVQYPGTADARLADTALKQCQ